MAFIEDNFGPVGGLHGEDRTDNETGVALFSYITADTRATVIAAGYFNELRNRVHQGDVLYLDSFQLTASIDATDNEYSIVYFDNVPRSPSAVNVTLNSKNITRG